MSTTSEVKRLSTAARRAGKALLAEDVWEASKDAKRWPGLNKAVWSKSQAELAKERQLQICHHLIMQIKVVTAQGTPQRQFVHLRQQERGYRPVDEVAAVIDMAMHHLERLQADIARARVRLTGFREVLPDEVSGEIDDAIKRAEDAIRDAIAKRRRDTDNGEAAA
jgi:undecaprenyl pyrophosphate synthase